MREFIHWYNSVHLHSAIGFTTPDSRHRGDDEEILANRDVVYRAAKLKNPTRWSRETRNWRRVDVVRLNCLKEERASDTTQKRQSAS